MQEMEMPVYTIISLKLYLSEKKINQVKDRCFDHKPV